MMGLEATSEKVMPSLKVTLAARDRAARIVARKRLGRLHSRIISDTTFQRYEKALRVFFEWILSNQLALPDNPVAFDNLIMSFIESRWEEGDG
jgi:hypothetical protein